MILPFANSGTAPKGDTLQTLYSYSGADAAEVKRTWREVVRREFYAGDLESESADEFDISAQRSMTHPISLIRTLSRSNMSFRRSQHHIRGSASFRLLVFVRQGSLNVIRSDTQYVVEAEQCAILNFDTPSLTQTSVGAEGTFEIIQAIVPSHLFLSHMAGADDFKAPFNIGSEDRHVIGKLLDVLFNEGAHLSKKAAEPLVAAFLETLADNVEALIGPSGRRLRAAERRMDEIAAYIDKNLTDPALNAEEVALHCGISPRYLCHVLKVNHTSFSILLWQQRLQKACSWLGSDSMKNHTIQEIAFMAGFKTAPHFSRMFKATYGASPGEYRADVG